MSQPHTHPPAGPVGPWRSGTAPTRSGDRASRAAWKALVGSALCVGVIAGCGGGGAPRSTPVPPTPTTPPATAPAVPSTSVAASTTTTPACSNARVISTWPVATRAARLIVLPSLNFDVAQLRAELLAGAGGVIFLGSAPAPADLAAQIQAAAAGAPAGAPLVMADEEGGGIQRLTGAVPSFPWPRQVAATMSVDQARQLGQTTGAAMRRIGVTVDLAPVLDVDGGSGPNSTDADGLRSYSPDPATAARYGLAFAAGLRAAGVLPVVKHFPGLGGTVGNTDDGPAATPPLSTLTSAGLVPFESAIAAGSPAVMVANASVPGLTPLPASLSSAAITGLLRGRLRFSGLVVTDSLSAGAISAAGYDVPHAAAAAVEAGADLILFGSTLTPAETALLNPANVAQTTQAIQAALVGAVQSGALPLARLDDAVGHVLAAAGTNLCT